MARRKNIVKSRSQSKRFTSRNKKIRKTERLQNKTPGWNKSLSFTTNITNLGMNNLHVNDKITTLTNKEETVKQFIDVEEMDISQIKLLNQMAVPQDQIEKKKNKVRLSVDEEWAIEALVQKYKDDYEQMKRDHKVNTFQWTSTQCKKKYDQYIIRYGKMPKN